MLKSTLSRISRRSSQRTIRSLNLAARTTWLTCTHYLKMMCHGKITHLQVCSSKSTLAPSQMSISKEKAISAAWKRKRERRDAVLEISSANRAAHESKRTNSSGANLICSLTVQTHPIILLSISILTASTSSRSLSLPTSLNMMSSSTAASWKKANFPRTKRGMRCIRAEWLSLPSIGNNWRSKATGTSRADTSISTDISRNTKPLRNPCNKSQMSWLSTLKCKSRSMK